MQKFTFLLILSALFSINIDAQTISGELKKWHKVSLLFTGPNTSETNATNPFMDYRLNVTFTHESGSPSYTVYGFYAADGNAAETSASSGDKWKVNFAPDKTGVWNYSVSFRTGTNIAGNVSTTAGTSAGYFDGTTGSITIAATDKTGRDFRGRGRAAYVGQHYLQLQETKEYFIKGGADSPENTLAYEDFDNTPTTKRKSWSPHQQDYLASDASEYTWKNGKGTELLGVIRYLSEIKGVNLMSFLTFSLDGDTESAYPHAQKISNALSWNDVEHTRFDVSKLEQWEKIFEYADKKGVYLHFKLMEQENDALMDGWNSNATDGSIGEERKAYLRELIARFGHHLTLNWNIGEEHSPYGTVTRFSNYTSAQQTLVINRIKSVASYIKTIDPYDHHIVVHTFPSDIDAIYNQLTGTKSELTGPSIQTDISNGHSAVVSLVNSSRNAGKKWVVGFDEQGSASQGVAPDPTDNTKVRKEVIWGSLLGGAQGFEFYYGSYNTTSNGDLDNQNHRSRDQKYTYAAHAINFFNTYLQSYLISMLPSDNLTSATTDYCYAQAGQVYVIYLPSGTTTNLNLGSVSGNYSVKWYNPESGGALQIGSVSEILGVGNQAIGNPPSGRTGDWVVLVENKGSNTNIDDVDNDGVKDAVDNCPNNANPLQEDDDKDGIGNICERLHYTYPGKSWKIPGVIEVPYFDLGGQNNAYFDDPASTNANFISPRTAATETELVEVDANNIGAIRNGEWVKYTVDSVKSGIYTIKISSTSQSQNTNFKIFLNDKEIATVVATATGGWDIVKEFSTSDVKIESELTNAVIKVMFVNTAVTTKDLCNFKTFSFEKTAEIPAAGILKTESEKRFSISPNPARNEFYINTTDVIAKQISIKNAVGMEVLSQAFGSPANNKYVVNENLKSGIYFVIITDINNRTYSKKLVIQ